MNVLRKLNRRTRPQQRRPQVQGDPARQPCVCAARRTTTARSNGYPDRYTTTRLWQVSWLPGRCVRPPSRPRSVASGRRSPGTVAETASIDAATGLRAGSLGALAGATTAGILPARRLARW